MVGIYPSTIHSRPTFIRKIRVNFQGHPDVQTHGGKNVNFVLMKARLEFVARQHLQINCYPKILS